MPSVDAFTGLPNIHQITASSMESIVKFSKFAFAKSMSVLIFGFAGFLISETDDCESPKHGDLSWHDDYLIGKSDMDAIWYYERRRWRS